MAKNDSRIGKSYENKQLGGYISIENIENEDIEFKYNMIYNSLGILQNGEEIWLKRLEEVKLYIDTNNKKPSTHDKYIRIGKIGFWICSQNQNYKNMKQIMSNGKIYKLWTEFINSDKYKQYFISNENIWKLKLGEVKKYIDINNIIPSHTDRDTQNKILGIWIKRQIHIYRNVKEIMLNEEIYKLWTDFINSDKYKEYFISNEYRWKLKLEQVKKYIDTNNKIPSNSDKYKQVKTLGRWVYTQSHNYNIKKCFISNKKIYNLWTEFINSDKYKSYFLIKIK